MPLSLQNLPSQEPIFEPDYPLQGSRLDLPLSVVLAFTDKQREHYISELLSALSKSIAANEMTLKSRVPFAKEMRDLRKLVRLPTDAYLYLDERTFNRNVLGKGSPGGTHTYWSRKFMWRMATRQGDLEEMILNRDHKLCRKLSRLFDGQNNGKELFRRTNRTAIENALSYLQVETGVGTAFPPFHARFLADRFLPKKGKCLVIDPCAGWGGRLLGTLCVRREDRIHYIGVDPEARNKAAYEGILRRIQIYLNNEIKGVRTARFFSRPFEEWIETKTALNLTGRADLVITSPPYYSAEIYNPENKKQSAIRYSTYELWRNNFYKTLVQGAYTLLRPGGVFVLNIANVAAANNLERDARILARESGFKNCGFFKLAMSVTPGTRTGIRHTVMVNGKVFKHEPVFCFRKPD